MTFAELLEEIKNLSQSEKATLRGLLSEDYSIKRKAKSF
jgi:hypothetical protein